MPDVTGHTIVEPIGSIIFYQHIPLDKSYEHSIKYTSQAAFDGMLGGYNNTAISAQSYSRLTKGSVRVEKPLSYLQNCNYMRISDSGFLGGKVYYAFVDGVEYINNETVDVFFTIDALMTYWKDFTVPANFVEREHCTLVDDVVGKNLVPESFELGDLIVQNTVDYTYNWLSYSVEPPTWWVVILYAPNYKDNEANMKYVNCIDYAFVETSTMPAQATAPQIRNGCIGGYCYVAFDTSFSNVSSSVKLLQEGIRKIEDISGQIIDVFLIPNEIYHDNFSNNTPVPHSATITQTQSFKSAKSNFVYSTVKNKKLFQYPFSQIVVSNNTGTTQTYRWEEFNEGSEFLASFGVINALSPFPLCYMYPINYRGKNNDFENGVMFNEFPKCSWSEDSYSKWWGQNKGNYGLSLATGLLSTGLMVAMGGAGGTAVTSASKMIDDVTNTDSASISPNGISLSRTTGAQTRQELFNSTTQYSGSKARQGMSLGMGAIGIARTIGQKAVAYNAPDAMHIQNNSAILQGIQNRIGYTIYHMGITAEMAEIIDSYFEMFGYATHKLKVPNFVNGGRPHWDYIKMQNAQIEPQTGGAGINAEALKTIEDIFNKGITLWADLAEVGNYNLNNHGN